MDPQPPDLRALAARFFDLDVAAPGRRVVACAFRSGWTYLVSCSLPMGLLASGIGAKILFGSADASRAPFESLESQ
jgi:hypothetical protein